MQTVADIHSFNTFAVARAIHAAGVCTRRELVEATGLSFSTVATICGKLIANQVLVEVGRAAPTVGRPTTKLALNPSHGVFLGVDIAETYVHVETLDLALDTVSHTRRETQPSVNSPEEVLLEVNAAIAEEQGRHPGHRLLGVGVAAPGQVDQAGGLSLFAPNWGWHDVPLIDMLAPSVSAPLYLDNPLKSLVLAEIWANPERCSQDFAVVNLGTGVGAAFAIEGKVHRGSTNSAGEWGHTVLFGDGRACRCGSRGCVEAYVGAPGIIQTLREADPGSHLLRGDDQTATINALRAAAAAKNDPTALEVIALTGHYLGMALASIVNFLNPSIIVVTGWVARQLGPVLIDQAQPDINSHSLAVPLGAVRIEQPGANGNAVCRGVAAQAFEGYLKSLPDTAAEVAKRP
ncbi:MAG: ROK family protein [Propionibacteriaceae bacterium]|jgi:predicted NBD/HSP70 family sugar kinase|nr:ROK family protein [Propionibacteriaceae bacterium]